jgi:hypothetical protein
MLKSWEREGEPTIVLKVGNEKEMMEYQLKAVSVGLFTQIIADAGRTEVESGSKTVLGVFGKKEIDLVVLKRLFRSSRCGRFCNRKVEIAVVWFIYTKIVNQLIDKNFFTQKDMCNCCLESEYISLFCEVLFGVSDM